MEPHLRAYPRYSGERKFFNFSSSIHCGGVPSGAAAFIVPEYKKSTISESWMNTTIFIGNALESQTKAITMNNRFSW